MDQAAAVNYSPHVLIFPFPAQGHVNSMLKLAELLSLSDMYITFVVSKNIHDRLLHHTNVKSRFSNYPGFYLEVLPREIDEDHPTSPDAVVKFFDALQIFGKPYLRELIDDKGSRNKRPPITSIIADGLLSAALEVAQEIGLPFIYLRTISACAFWAYFCIPQLIEAGELPFSGVVICQAYAEAETWQTQFLNCL
ncbi:hypothetical protein M9H77_10929 [Catharanthus roseus]|uniref:Uncharacterized protein n=1 Tax=Catharanthus roseus TaxID=4058 RepID=A0ACC0BD11_CATRO|nr:hypothetical protein M9H77_10929 [Catharanthus roseus]